MKKLDRFGSFFAYKIDLKRQFFCNFCWLLRKCMQDLIVFAWQANGLKSKGWTCKMCKSVQWKLGHTIGGLPWALGTPPVTQRRVPPLIAALAPPIRSLDITAWKFHWTLRKNGNKKWSNDLCFQILHKRPIWGTHIRQNHSTKGRWSWLKGNDIKTGSMYYQFRLLSCLCWWRKKSKQTALNNKPKLMSLSNNYLS